MRTRRPDQKNNNNNSIECTIHRSYKSITSSNDTNISEMLTFSFASNITTERNSRNLSNGVIIFGIDGNFQKPVTSNKTHITIATADLIIPEGLSFNLYQKSIFKKVLDLARNSSKTFIPHNRNIISKELLDIIHE